VVTAISKILIFLCLLEKALIEKEEYGPGMVVYTCNPSYLGGRHREDHRLKPGGKS
jgi:hypothetical protein